MEELIAEQELEEMLAINESQYFTEDVEEREENEAKLVDSIRSIHFKSSVEYC